MGKRDCESVAEFEYVASGQCALFSQGVMQAESSWQQTIARQVTEEERVDSA